MEERIEKREFQSWPVGYTQSWIKITMYNTCIRKLNRVGVRKNSLKSISISPDDKKKLHDSNVQYDSSTIEKVR